MCSGLGGWVVVGMGGGQAGLDKIPTFSETHWCMAPLWIIPPPIRGKTDLFHFSLTWRKKQKEEERG